MTINNIDIDLGIPSRLLHPTLIESMGCLNTYLNTLNTDYRINTYTLNNDINNDDVNDITIYPASISLQRSGLTLEKIPLVSTQTYTVLIQFIHNWVKDYNSNHINNNTLCFKPNLLLEDTPLNLWNQGIGRLNLNLNQPLLPTALFIGRDIACGLNRESDMNATQILRQLMNDIQMYLYEYPVDKINNNDIINTVNSVWFNQGLLFDEGMLNDNNKNTACLKQAWLHGGFDLWYQTLSKFDKMFKSTLNDGNDYKHPIQYISLLCADTVLTLTLKRRHFFDKLFYKNNINNTNMINLQTMFNIIKQDASLIQKA